MIEQPLTLIIGAGASAEFKMPVGSKLASDIATLTRNLGRDRGYDPVFSRKIGVAFGQDSGPYFEAGRLISDGVKISRSIDDFLDNHRADPKVVTVGKMGIAHAILRAERDSALLDLTSRDREKVTATFEALSDTWAWTLLSWLVTGRSKADRMQVFENLRIINFNYDRCLEMFLWVGLQRSYGVDEDDAAAIMKTLSMSHPYGRVGSLPWENSRAEQRIIFGQDPDTVDVHILADQIKTFTERNHTDEERAVWTEYVATSRRVCFLGFGFHRQNVELITPTWKTTSRRPMIFGTTKGLSPAALKYHTQKLQSAFYVDANNIDPQLADRTSSEFLNQWETALFQ